MFYDVWTVFWRDWLVLKRRLGRYVLARMISPVLYLVAFGWGVGRSIAFGQASYLDFIVPGIIALNSMNISFSSVASPLNMSRLYHKTLEEYLTAPISTAAFLSGKILSGALRGMLSSFIIVALAAAFGAQLALTPLFFALLLLNCLFQNAVHDKDFQLYSHTFHHTTYIILEHARILLDFSLLFFSHLILTLMYM